MSRLGQIQQGRDTTEQARVGAGIGLWILLATVLALCPGFLRAQTYIGDPVDLGFRDFEYTGGTSEITEEKPESKLWHHDGLWWAVLWEPNSATFRVHKFDRNAHSWTNVGPEVDDRSRSAADVLVDGNVLYISSRAKLNIQASKSEIAILNRYTYNSGSKSYTLDSGFPVQITGTHKSRSMTLAKDSNNKLWVTWENDSSVVVNRTDGLDDTNWGAAFLLPSVGSKTKNIDISALTAFKGDRIGVLWSNQNDEVMYFSVHFDSSPDTTWQARETVLNGQPNMADDHINLAVRESDGTVLAITKTGLGGSTNPNLVLSRRDGTTGVWTNHVAWETVNDMTRPVVLYNSTTDSAYVFGKSDAVSPKTIFFKGFDVDNPTFDATSLGRIFMRSQIDNEANNITSTKQEVTNTTGILVLASDRNTKRYLHRYFDFTNNLPVASDDSYTINQGAATVLDVTGNDSDSDGTIDATTTAVVIAPDSGTVSINSTTGELTYTPVSSFKGTETFKYTVSDNDGANALAATITVTINGVPVAGDDNVATDEDTPVDFSPLNNDSDPDGLVISSLSVTGTPANGTFNYNTTTGVMTYTPSADFHGTDAMTYTVADGSGATSNTATISLTINDINDLPVAQDEALAADNETPVVIDVLANDSDSDGTLQPATVAITQSPGGGTTSINTTTGAITYTANPGFFGEDSLHYTVADDDGGVTNAAKVTLTVSAVPVAAQDSVVTDASVAVVIDVLANDSDADGSLIESSVAVSAAPANGTTSINPITGAITYTPSSGFVGKETFFYTVDDNSGLTSSPGKIIVRVFGPPIANDDNVATELNTPIDIDILANDQDLDGGTLVPASVNVFLGPFNGSIVVSPTTGIVSYTPNNNFGGTDIMRYTVDDNDGSTSNDAVITIRVTVAPTAVDDNGSTSEDTPVQIDVTSNDSDSDGSIDPSTVVFPSAPANGSVSADTNGIVTYTPAADYFGSDTFTYTVQDNDGLASNAATVSVTISPVNDAPVAQNDTAATTEESPVQISAFANDTDVDGSVVAASVTLTSLPSNGSATVNVTTGVVTYTPVTDFFGQDSLKYTIDDNSGATSNAATVVINVSDVNDPPLANADVATTPEETAVSVAVTSNDSDIDGTVDATTVTVTTPPLNGTASVNATTGEVNYTPATDFFGNDSLQYTVEDDRGGVSNPASVVFTVTNVNDPPLAAADTASTIEETPVDITVAANDTDQDGSIVPASVVVSSQPGNGSADVNPITGVVTYTPVTDFSGADTFAYTIDDDNGATSAPAIVVVNVTDVNDPPVAVGDTATTPEDQSVDIDLAGNDTDIDGSPVPTSIQITSQPSQGSASVNPGTGLVTYTPATDFVGSDTFQYTIDDDDGATSGVATVAVSVTSVNDAPVAADDAATTLEENSIDIDVVANDSDVDGTVDATTVMVASGPQNGSISVNPVTGSINYSPDTDFSGDDSLRYSVKDNNGLVSNLGKVTITVTDVNDAPVANDDSASTNEEVAVVINVVGNDTDIDGSLVFPTLIASPGANGATSINPATGEITYTPSAGFSGTDSFIYRINDDDGATSNDATVSVTVNNAPIALDDSTSTNENTPVTIDVAANDSDANGVLDLTSVSIASAAGNGTTSVNPTTGAITYTPGTDFSGTEVFSYSIDDNAGATSTPATIKVFVNDTPVAVDDNATTNEDSVVQIDIVANDTDSDGALDPTSVTIASDVNNGATSVNPATGVVSYTPASNFSGQDGFTYSLKDDRGVTSNLASVTISVNDAPVALDDTASVDETTPVVVAVLANDTDSDGSLLPGSVTVTNAPANGSTTVNAATGTITYTANTAFFGLDTFTYTVEDDRGATSNQATVGITVVDVNDIPVAQNDAATTLEDSPIAVNVLSNDSDADGSIDPTTVAITHTSNGSAVPNPGNGLVTYTPAPDFFGADTFRYTVKDLAGGTSNEGLVVMTVLGVNDPPRVVNDTVSTQEDTPLVIAVTANDSDVDGTMDVLTIVNDVANGSTVVNSTTGQVTYTPNANFSGPDSFTYTVRDNNGGTSSAASVFITVSSQNDLPVAVDDNVSTPEDIAIPVDLLANDTDVDGTISPASIGILVGPANGGYSLNSSTGILTYTPDADFFGVDSLTYVVQDNEGALSNQARVRVTVTDVNDAPVASDDNAATPEDTPVAISVVANDNDIDGTLDTITITGAPSNGSTAVNNAAGTVTYTPNQNFAGGDQFTYTVQDDDGASSNTATVTVNVASENDPPTAADDDVSTAEDTPVIVAVLANDSDPDGTLIPASVIITSSASHATTSVNPANGDITYTPDANFFGDDSLTYVVQDDIGANSNTGTVRVAVTSVNDLPVAVDDNVGTAEDTPVTVPVTANDSDSDGTLVSLTITVAATNGSTFINNGTGEITYTPDLNFFGADQFTYTVTDNDGGTSNTATVVINVSSDNDLPVAINDTVNVDEDSSIEIAVLANDSDSDGTLIANSVLIVSLAKAGSASVNSSTGTISYSPTANFFGSDSLEYLVQDNLGALSNAAKVLVNVNSVNDLPVVADDAASTTEDTPVTIAVTSNDQDIDGTIVTINVTDDVNHGSTSINNGTGEITYTPAQNFNGPDTLRYSVQDDAGGISNVATVALAVQPQDDPPLAVQDSVGTSKNTPVVIAVLANDSDVDGSLQPSTVAVVTPPANGSTSVNVNTGAITYSPNTFYFGPDSFEYTVQDDAGATSNAGLVKISVVGANEVPIAVNDTVATDEDTPLVIAVTANDTEIDGSFNFASLAVGGAAAHGTTSVNPTTGEITYSPGFNFFGSDSFTYTIEDDAGAVTNVATVLISVNSVNDLPVTNADNATTPEEQQVMVDVVTNDFDSDGSLATNTLTIISGPQSGSASPNPTTGEITYAPGQDFEGADSLQYTIEDNDGGLSSPATVRFTVTGINDAPVAVNDSAATTLDTPVSIAILANDIDVDGTIDTTTLSVTLASHGTTALNSSGVLTYTPDAGFGGVESFTYTFRDNLGLQSNIATVRVRVGTSPMANADTLSTNEEVAVTGNVLSNDLDPDGSLVPASLTIASQPGNGAVSANLSTGEITYTPAPDFFGTDTFTYTVDDDEGNTSLPGTVVVNVAGINDPPMAVRDSAATAEDTPVAISVVANDTDNDGTIVAGSVAIATGPAHGAVQIAASTGILTYTPNLDFFGDDSLTYTIADNDGATSVAGTVFIAVTPANDAPVALNDGMGTTEDTPATFNVLSNDSDGDGTIDPTSVSLETSPANGTAQVNGTTGEIDYAPAADFSGLDSLNYTVKDNQGAVSNIATLTISVAQINDSPVAVNDTASTNKNVSIDIAVTSNDLDVDGTIDTGSLAISAASHGTTSLKPGGIVAYTPAQNFIGVDSLTYTVRDDEGAISNSASVLITVTSAPLVVDDHPTIIEGQVASIDVLANDSDPDGTIDPTTVVFETQPSIGTATINPATGVVAFTPSDPDFTSNDSFIFSYRVRDNEGNLSDSAGVFLTVTDVNDPPVAQNDAASTPEDTPVQVSVVDNDTDIDGVIDPTTVTITVDPKNGSASVNSTSGVVTYSPSANFFGTDSLNYTVADEDGAISNEGIVVLAVATQNDPPVAVADQAATNEDVAVVIAILANDIDSDGTVDATQVSITSNPVHGSVAVNPVSGTLTYTPATDFAGEDSASYTVRDNLGAISNVAKVTIAVSPVNDAPLAVDDVVATGEDTPVSANVLSNDSDVDGLLAPPSVAIVVNPVNGTATVNPTTGEINYTPNLNFAGTDVLSYTVDDNDGLVSNQAQLTINITNQNDFPVATADTAATSEDVAVTVDILSNDVDLDGTLDPATVTVVDPPGSGTTVVNPATGVITYTPASDFFGDDSLKYTVKDNLGASTNLTRVLISVSPVNDPPQAVADTATTGVNVAVDIDVLGNDTDIDGTIDVSTVALATTPLNGSVSVAANGLLTYTPATGFEGQDTFTYVVQDELAATSAAATVSVNVVAGGLATKSFDSIHDGQVKVTELGSNYGTKGTTKVEDGKFITYLKFNVSGVSGAIQSASVQLRVTDDPSDGGPDGGSIFQVSNDFKGTAVPWVETTLNSGNAPVASGSPLSSAGSVSPGQTIEFDVTGVVSGNGAFSFAVVTASGNQVKYSTKEGVVAPKLILKTGTPPPNTAPVAVNDVASTPADTPIAIDVLSNDSDSDGTLIPATVTVGAAPINGTTSVNVTTGAITYSPNPAFQGNDLFTYSVNDDAGAASNTATVDVTVTSGLVPPVAGNDTATTTGTTPIGIDVTVNDVDSDGTINVATVVVTTAPLNGSATVNSSTGIVTYTANPAFLGIDEFSYTVQDDDALTSNVAVVNVTVVAGNASPVAQNDNATTPEDTPVVIEVVTNDSDADGTVDVTSVSVATAPLNGTTVVNAGTGAITYTPSLGFVGSDSFTYTVADNLSAVSNAATVTVTVTSSGGGQTLTFTPVGDGQVKLTDPVANYGTKETMKVDGNKFSSYLKFVVNGVSGAVQSAKVQLQITTEVSDGGPSGGSIFLVDNVFSGTATPWVEGTLASGNAPAATGSPLQTQGAVSPNQLVEFDVTPAVSGNGTFSFAITPTSTNQVKYYTKEGSVAPKLVVITGSGGGNQAPLAADDNATTTQDNAITVDVTANDSDSDGTIDVSTVTIVAQPGNGSVSVNSATGVVTYTPNSGFSGSDTFTYTVDDDQSATSNVAHVAITVNAAGGGQTLTFSSVADGQVKLTEPGANYGSKGTMKVDGGKFSSYMKFQVTGVSGAVTSAKIRLLVAAGISDGGDSGGSIFQVANTFNGSATPWDEATLTSGNAPATSGSPIQTLGAVNPSELVEFDVTGSVSGNGTFSFAVTPTSGNKVKYFTKEGTRAPELVIATGSGGGGSDPVAVNDNASGVQDLPLTIDVTANDSDPDGTIDVTTVQVTAAPTNGAATVNSTSGVITYSPNSGFSGSDSFSYTVKDNEGRSSNVAIVTVIISAGNQPPVAANDNSSANAGAAVAIDVTVNDSDGDGTLDLASVTIVSGPANGTATVNTSNGLISYTSDAGFDGTDTFTYTVNDNDGATSNIATVTVQVTGGSNSQTFTFEPTDDAQIKLTSNSNYGSKATMKVEAQKFSLYLKFDVTGLSGAVQNAKIKLRVTDDPSDGGPAGGSILLASNSFDDSPTPWVEETLTLSNAPAAIGGVLSSLGAVSANQLVEFDVTSAISGNGTFSFLVRGDSGNQVKYFTKEGLSTKPELVVEAGGSGGGGNSAPVAVNDNATTTSGTPVPIDVTLNDSDSDGTLDVTTVVVVTPPANGSTNVSSSTGVVTYTPNSGFSGSDTFAYTVRDDDGATSNAASVSINVSDGNQPPLASDDISTTVAGNPIAIDVTLNDSDSDGTINVTTVAVVTQPTNGSASVSNVTGVVTYTPNSGFSGTDSFTYTVQDDGGAVSNAATVTVTVLAGSGGTVTFTPTEDGQTKISDPGANYGTKGTMKVERGKFDSYLKFDVSGVTGSVQDAIVRLHVTVDPGDGSDSGGSIYLTSNNFTGSATPWQEETLTSGNAPDLLSGALSTLGEVAENQLVDFDVTGALNGNGTFSFCIRTGNGDQVKYYTKEGLTAPQLIITSGSGAGAEFAGKDAIPTAVADEIATEPGVSVAIDVLANDTAQGSKLLRSTVAAVTMPAHGQVRFDAMTDRLVYSPAAGFNGKDSFDYIVQGLDGRPSNPAKVTIIVGSSPANTPIARADAAVGYQGVPVTIAILDNDDQVGGSMAEIVSPPEHGTVTLDSDDGLVVYAADGTFFGQDGFTYVLKRADGSTSEVAQVGLDIRESKPQVLALLPTDDAFVRSSAPTDNFGKWDELRATNGSAEFYSFLKFEVSGLTGALHNAALKLYVTDHSERGRVIAVANTYRDSGDAWNEDGLVWDNAPPVNGGPHAEFEVPGKGRYVEIDVTSMVTGEGTFSFAVSSEHQSDAATFVSKEGAHPPQLVVTTGAPIPDGALEASANDDSDAAIPTTISLSPNFPNPFNAETTIIYALPADAKVKLEIYNIRGQLVKTLVDGSDTAGRKRLKWFGRDNAGIDVSSGVYFMRLEVGKTKFARRILLQK